MIDQEEWLIVKKFDWGWANIFNRGSRPQTFASESDAEAWMRRRGIQGNEWRVVTVGEFARGGWQW